MDINLEIYSLLRHIFLNLQIQENTHLIKYQIDLLVNKNLVLMVFYFNK